MRAYVSARVLSISIARRAWTIPSVTQFAGVEVNFKAIEVDEMGHGALARTVGPSVLPVRPGDQRLNPCNRREFRGKEKQRRKLGVVYLKPIGAGAEYYRCSQSVPGMQGRIMNASRGGL